MRLLLTTLFAFSAIISSASADSDCEMTNTASRSHVAPNSDGSCNYKDAKCNPSEKVAARDTPRRVKPANNSSDN